MVIFYISAAAALVSCSTVKTMNADDWNRLVDLGQKVVQDARALGADINEVKAAIDEVKAREEAAEKAAEASPLADTDAIIITGGK